MPEPAFTVPDEREQLRVVEFVVIPSATVPVKPFRGETVMVELPTTLAVVVTVVGFAETAKSFGCVTW